MFAIQLNENQASMKPTDSKSMRFFSFLINIEIISRWPIDIMGRFIFIDRNTLKRFILTTSIIWLSWKRQ